MPADNYVLQDVWKPVGSDKATTRVCQSAPTLHNQRKTDCNGPSNSLAVRLERIQEGHVLLCLLGVDRVLELVLSVCGLLPV